MTEVERARELARAMNDLGLGSAAAQESGNVAVDADDAAKVIEYVKRVLRER